MNINNIFRNALIFSEYKTRRHSYNSKIVFYHDVHDKITNASYTYMSTNFPLFSRHMETIVNEGFEITPHISCLQKQIQIVFDDGWLGVYNNKDYFIENKIFPTICIAPGLLNHPSYLSDKQVIELYGEGFGFVCHSWSHQSLTLYNSRDALIRELVDSKKYIEDLLSNEVKTICYPNGFFSKRIYDASLEFGYSEIWTSIAGDYYDEPLPYLKKRCLAQGSSINALKMTILGANRILGEKQFKTAYKNY